MTSRMIIRECDSCAAGPRVLDLCQAGGIETYACTECRRGWLSDDIDDLEDELDRLKTEPESEERFARVCAVEAALLEAIESLPSPVRPTRTTKRGGLR